MDDAAFHLARGLVGEGDGEYVAVGVAVAGIEPVAALGVGMSEQQSDVFVGESVCLARSRRGPVYRKHLSVI